MSVDHIAEAEDMLEAVAATKPSPGDDEVRVMLTVAQVHATLALAEQQRVTNRLKVAELDLLHELGSLDNALDFRLVPYLTHDEWASITVPDNESGRVRS